LALFYIGELAEEFGLSLRTLRFWEEREILVPRRSGRDRLYTAADRNRVREIVAWSTAGFSLREIRSMQLMTRTLRKEFLQARLPELQSEADAAYAERCRAIQAIRQQEQQSDLLACKEGEPAE